MKALVFGRTEQVALELARSCPEGVTLVQLGREAADFIDQQACVAALAQHRPDVVINAVAYTAVDHAEEDEATATAVNATTPGALAQACAATDTPFLHVSTDYVFDGSGDRPWQPGDATGPMGAYGRSKLAGEEAIRAADGLHVILRTSWVISAHGNYFVKTMLRLSETRDRLTIVADLVGRPTPAASIAQVLWTMAQAFDVGTSRSGTHHFSGAPDVSWADFTRGILDQAGRQVEVVGVPSSDYPTPAARPANSRMDCRSLQQASGIARSDWRGGLTHILADLKEHTT